MLIVVMDGQGIITIINNALSLSNTFGCILASDDVEQTLTQPVNRTGHNFIQWPKSIFLQYVNESELCQLVSY